MVIEVDVSNKIASLVNKSVVGVCGNSDYVIRFNFDDEWAAYETKTARFKYNGSYTDVIFTGNDCPMPIVQNTYNVEIGVYAGDLHTTTSAYLPMKKSILCGSGSPADPEPDVYNQLMDKLNNLDVKGYEELSGEMGNLDNLKTDAKDNLVEAINEAATVPDYNQNDETAPDYIKNRPFYDTREYNTAFVSELGNIEANGYYKVPNFTIDGITYVDVSLSYNGENITIRYETPTIQDLSESFGLDANSALLVSFQPAVGDFNKLNIFYFISAEAITAAQFPATDGAGWYVEEYEGDTDVKLTGIRVNGELKTIDTKYTNGFGKDVAKIHVIEYGYDEETDMDTETVVQDYEASMPYIADNGDTDEYALCDVVATDGGAIRTRLRNDFIKTVARYEELYFVLKTTIGTSWGTGSKYSYSINNNSILARLERMEYIYPMRADIRNASDASLFVLNTILTFKDSDSSKRTYTGVSVDTTVAGLWTVEVTYIKATEATAHSATITFYRII